MAIVKVDLMDDATLLKITTRIVPLLHHPGACIRDAVVGVLAAFIVAGKLDHASVQIQIVPLLRPFFFEGRLESAWLLGSSGDVDATERTLRSLLRPPTDRRTFEEALRWYEEKKQSKISSPGSNSRDVFLHASMRARVLNKMRQHPTDKQRSGGLPREYGSVLLKHVQVHSLSVPTQASAISVQPRAGTPAESTRTHLRTYGLLSTPADSYNPRATAEEGAYLNTDAMPEDEARATLQRLWSLNVPKLPPDMGTLRRSSGHDRSVSDAFKPRTIVTSLHEHSGAVNRIAVSKDGLYFATASDDGSVRIWLSPRLERAAYSRSTLTYSSQAGRITDVCTIGSTHSIASASDQGSVHVFKVEHAYEAAQSVSLQDAGRARLGVSTILEIDGLRGWSVCSSSL